MRLRPRAVAAAPVILTATVAALVLRPPAAAPEADDPFDRLRERLATFETAYVEVPMGVDTVTGVPQWPATLHVSSRGQLAYDDGRDTRWIWTGETLHQVHTTRVPVHVESHPAPPRYAEVWAELRSGFAHSTLRRVVPAELGYTFHTYPNEDTVLIELPFAWARAYAVFVTLSPLADRLTRVVVTDRGTKEVAGSKVFGRLDLHFDHRAQFWDVPLQRSVFEPCGVRLGWSRAAHEDRSVRGGIVGLQEPVDPRWHLPHEVCASLEGHRHGQRIHAEHDDDEIHGGAVGDRSGCFPDAHRDHEPRGRGDVGPQESVRGR